MVHLPSYNAWAFCRKLLTTSPEADRSDRLFCRIVRRTAALLGRRLQIRRGGDVVAPSVTKSSGDAELDQAAVRAVKTWRYSPATKGGSPVPITIRQQVVFSVRALDTVTFYEIIVSRKELADSLWNLLSQGADFSDLAVRFSEAASASRGGLRETVRYDALSTIIKITLERLSPNQYSQPFERPDGRFMILKRKKA